MKFDISKAFFEMAVPAFKSATANTYDKLQTFIAAADHGLSETIGTAIKAVKEDAAMSEQAMKLICITAARTAVPQLDLVMTAQGFGIVSTGNISPASRERVLALQEQLRKMESDTMELFCMALLDTEWCGTKMAETTVWGLMWCPCLLRRYGVQYKDQRIYYEEMELMRTDIIMAEEQLANIISDDLYQVLLQMVRGRKKDLDPAYELVLEKSRKFLAALLRNDSRGTNLMLHALQKTLNDNEGVLKEYQQSSICQSVKMPQYENKKEDPCVFF